MKEKRNDRLAMIITLLITCFIVIFLIANVIHVLSQEKPQEQEKKLEEKTETKEEGTLTEEEKERFLSLIKIYDDSFIQYDGTKDPKDLTTQEKLDFVYKLNNTERLEWNIDWSKPVSISRINAVLEAYFGPNGTLTDFSDYNCPIDNLPLLVYDDITESYSLDTEEHGHGGFSYSLIENYYIEGEKEENIYSIKVKKVFSNLLSDSSAMATTYYKTYQDATLRQDPVFDLYALYGENAFIDQEEKVNRQYQKNKDLFPIYTYQFQEEEGSLYLIKLELEQI